MKLEDQVLSIEQVRELQELGFDIEKHSSMCWVEQSPFLPDEEPVKYELEILTDSLIGNRGNLDVIPTLTIGDIIEVLPKSISNELYFLYALQVHPRDKNKYYSAYKFDYDHTCLISFEDENPLFSLFEALKWCIKEKYIKL